MGGEIFGQKKHTSGFYANFCAECDSDSEVKVHGRFLQLVIRILYSDRVNSVSLFCGFVLFLTVTPFF